MSPKIIAWISLFVAIGALAASVYAIYIDNKHYTEITVPHTRFDEIRDRLYRLDERIERAQGDIDAAENIGEDSTESRASLQLAIDLRGQAETQWDHGNYSTADTLISEAYDNLDKIPQLHVFEMYWALIIGSIIGVILIILIVALRRLKPSSNRESVNNLNNEGQEGEP